MVNQVTLIGYAGAAPELKEVGNGTPVARFSLATSENWKNDAGEWQSKTQWHNVIVWRKLAEVIAAKVQKGTRVYVAGKIEYREYEKDGVKRYITDIVASEVKILEKQEGGASPKFPSEAPAEKHYNGLGEPVQVPMQQPEVQLNADDLPF